MSDESSTPLYSTSRWGELRALLDRLAEAPPEMRAAELERIATTDAELARTLRELLAGTSSETAHDHDRVVERLMPAGAEAMPARVGPFRLLHRVGAGGMGVVYLAEREHADFVQRVALKLLDGGSQRLSQLATRERRILAALAHPNITAFVDAGTLDGRAWLAMEYVDGKPLLDYCRQHELPLRERVALFDQICAAVAHAHAQLVVHRDLKPSNVLVNAEGVAKLLDFGIALALDPEAEAAPATRVFTPEYAAPEQLRGERATTATDVYGLGLILYEVVAGKRLPTLERGLREGEWTTAELARYATTRDSTLDASTPAQPDARSLSWLLRGDLGRIIAHALQPSPTARYASVSALRDDLARWLDCRPLAIGRVSVAYAARRFMQRHRLGASLAALGVLAILGLAATAFWQARAKGLEAENARTALRQSEATREFITNVFLSADPYFGKGVQTTVGELLVAARSRIDQELANEPDIAAKLLHQIGNIYVSLGDDEAAIETLRKGLDANARSAHPSPALEWGAKARLTFIGYSGENRAETLRNLETAVAQLRAAGPSARGELATALRIIANVYYTAERSDEAIAALTESMALLQALGSRQQSEYLLALQALADMLAALDRNAEALALADQGLEHPYILTPEGVELANQLRGVRARALTGLGRYVEAESMLVRVIASSKSALGVDNFNTRYWVYCHVQVLQELGRLDEARAELQTLIDTPPNGAEHPMARIAHIYTAASIDNQRRDGRSAVDAQRALDLACGKDGAPSFCAPARLLVAEVAVREQRADAARAALAVCAADESIAKPGAFARRLNLLRARSERDSGQLEAAGRSIAAIESEGRLTPAETAQLDVERGLLALAVRDAQGAAVALQRARDYYAKTLALPTPALQEIEVALAAASGKH